MSDNPNATPAGESEQTASDDNNGPIDMDAAARMLADWDTDEPEETAAADSGETDQPEIETSQDETEAAAEETDGDEDTADDEDTSPDDTEQEPEDDAEPDEKLHGNTRTRLRDGTEVTVGELKKGYDELREYRAKAPQLAAQERQLSERAAQIAQQEQFVQQVLPQAVALLQAYLPPEPDPALLQTDPLAHYEQSCMRNQAINQLQQFQGAWQAQQLQDQRQAQQAAEAERMQRIDAGHKMLQEKAPELLTPEKAMEFHKGFRAAGARYGFTDEELDDVDDPRVILWVHDLSRKAAAYEKLMSQKRKADKKAKGTTATPVVPVQKPGPRVSAEVQEQRQENEVINRAMKTGRRRDAEAALALFE